MNRRSFLGFLAGIVPGFLFGRCAKAVPKQPAAVIDGLHRIDAREPLKTGIWKVWIGEESVTVVSSITGATKYDRHFFREHRLDKGILPDGPFTMNFDRPDK